MASFLYIGNDPRDFPSDDGIHPSRSVVVGEIVEADENPDPRWFDPTDTGPAAPEATAATTDTDPPTAAVTEGTE